MTALWSNPEFLRNARAQLRPGKLAATACICAALSIVIGYASSHQNYQQVAYGPGGMGPTGRGNHLLVAGADAGGGRWNRVRQQHPSRKRAEYV